MANRCVRASSRSRRPFRHVGPDRGYLPVTARRPGWAATAQRLAVLGRSAVINIGPTMITGDVGRSDTDRDRIRLAHMVLCKITAVTQFSRNPRMTLWSPTTVHPGEARSRTLRARWQNDPSWRASTSPSLWLSGSLPPRRPERNRSQFMFLAGSTLLGGRKAGSRDQWSRPLPPVWQVGSWSPFKTETSFVVDVLVQVVTARTMATFPGHLLAGNGPPQRWIEGGAPLGHGGRGPERCLGGSLGVLLRCRGP